MITVITTPNNISLSKNPVILKLKATDSGGEPYGAKGATAYVQTNVDGFQVNDTLKIEWEDTDGSPNFVEFTAKASPTLSTEITAQPSGLSALEYFELVASEISAHPLISPFFSLVASTPSAGFWRITATAKNTSTDFTFEWDITGVSVGSNPTTLATAAVADNTPVDHEVFLDVYFEEVYGSDTYLLSASKSAIPDTDGFVTFDLSKVLHSECKKSFISPVPDISTTEPFKADVVRRFYYRYRENYEGVYDNPLNTDGIWQQSSVYKTLFGGISTTAFPYYDFFAEIDEDNSLLTWYPDNKTVGEDQPEYISWFNYHATAKQVVLTCTAFDEDNNPTTQYYFTTSPLTIEPNEVLTIPVSPSLLPVTTNKPKYRVTVRDFVDYNTPSGQNFSQSRTYYIDSYYREEVRHVVYLNSFNCPEVQRFVGKTAISLAGDRGFSKKILQENYQVEQGETFQFDEEFETLYTYRSGHIRKSEVLALQELLMYGQAYEVHDTGYFPLILNSKRFAITQTFQFLHSIEFQAQHSMSMLAYTPLDLQSITIYLPCEITLHGTYDSISDAQTAGISADEYFLLSVGNVHGMPPVVVQYSPSTTYANDTAALAALGYDSCYAVSAANPYGLILGIVRVLPKKTTVFTDDAGAIAGGLTTGDLYTWSASIGGGSNLIKKIGN